MTSSTLIGHCDQVNNPKICEAVCAFANDLPGHRKTGVVFVGVDDRGHCANLPITDQLLLTHGRPWDWPPDYPAAALEAIWPPLQEELAALVPDGRLVVAEQSGHFIPGDQPEVVIAAIRQVVDAVRDPASWATPDASPVP